MRETTVAVLGAVMIIAGFIPLAAAMSDNGPSSQEAAPVPLGASS